MKIGGTRYSFNTTYDELKKYNGSKVTVIMKDPRQHKDGDYYEVEFHDGFRYIVPEHELYNGLGEYDIVKVLYKSLGETTRTVYGVIMKHKGVSSLMVYDYKDRTTNIINFFCEDIVGESDLSEMEAEFLKEIARGYQEISEIEAKREILIDRFNERNGIMPIEEFAEVLIKNLPSEIKDAIKEGGWELKAPTEIPYVPNDIHFSRFIEMRGKIFEANDLRHTLPISATYNERYKKRHRYAYFAASYTIPITKPLTAEYALELAKELVQD